MAIYGRSMLWTRPANLRRYLVEVYWSGVTEPQVVQTMRRVHQAAQDLIGEGSEISCLSAFFIPDDEVAFCLFDAASIETVDEACRLAELPFDRILQVVQIDTSRGGEE